MSDFLIVWGVLALPFAIWAGSIAEYRGRATWIGWVLALIFGVFGVPLAWLLPPNELVVWERRRQWERLSERGHSARIPSAASGTDAPQPQAT